MQIKCLFIYLVRGNSIKFKDIQNSVYQLMISGAARGEGGWRESPVYPRPGSENFWRKMAGLALGETGIS
ncbi:hypothetical protein AO745_19805 [Aeromonas veronii]|nr:hypothetical protein AO745_19805 [Aeromonas veronii]